MMFKKKLMALAADIWRRIICHLHFFNGMDLSAKRNQHGLHTVIAAAAPKQGKHFFALLPLACFAYAFLILQKTSKQYYNQTKHTERTISNIYHK